MSIKPEDRVMTFVMAVTDAAIEDHGAGVAERDPSKNTGEALRVRLRLDKYRNNPRRGDSRYARALYKAVRFLLLTENDA